MIPSGSGESNANPLESAGLRPAVICLTPIRNEERNLHRFLSCASLWADSVVLLDQGSEDRSREIATAFPKVIWRSNSAPEYHEQSRQAQLIAAGRSIQTESVMLALDADEVLTADSLTSAEWTTVRTATPGTVFSMRRINFLPDFREAWYESQGHYFPFGFSDNGAPHTGRAIHSERVPVTSATATIKLDEIKCLHYQYADWADMRSKHRWYQCWETINNSSRRASEIFRQYHHMYGMPRSAFMAFNDEWIRGYVAKGIDMTTLQAARTRWWDSETVALFGEHSPKRFRKLAIWDCDWNAIARTHGVQDSSVNDPRTFLDKLVQKWLWCSQGYRDTSCVKALDRALKVLGY